MNATISNNAQTDIVTNIEASTCEETDCEICKEVITDASKEELFKPYHDPGTIITMKDGTTYRVSERGNWVKIIK